MEAHVQLINSRPGRLFLVTIAITLAATAAAVLSLTAREPVRQRACPACRKSIMQTYTVSPRNGNADVRTAAGATSPMCAGNSPQGGSKMPAAVIAEILPPDGMHLRVLDQRGDPIRDTPVVVTCSMLVPEDSTG
jgi:hypothetical protein